MYTRNRLLRRLTSLALALILVSLFFIVSAESAPALSSAFDFPLGPPNGTGYGHYPKNGYDVHNDTFPNVPPYDQSCFGPPWADLWHAGEDWYANAGGSATAGATVTAVANGTVYSVQWQNVPPQNGYPGAVIIIEHTFASGEKVYSQYGHLQSVQVSVGQDVSKGQTLGYVLDQGSDSHLHWEIRTFADGSFICGGSAGPAAPGYTYPGRPDTFGYINPSNFIWYNKATDGAYLFTDTFFRGLALKVSDQRLIDLRGFSDIYQKMSSVSLPEGWYINLYKNPDGSGGSSKVVTLGWDDLDFTNNKFGDGSSLNDSVAAIEVFQCYPGGGGGGGGWGSLFVRSALASPACQNVPTPTQGTYNPTLPPAVDGIQLVSAAPIEVSPGEGFDPSVTIKVTSGHIDPSDYLHATPEDSSNTFGAHPLQGVTQVVNAGQNFTFDSRTTTQFHMVAPQQTGTYQSVWRMHINGQDTGPNIVIPITVRTVSPPHPYDYWDADYYTSKDLSGSVAYHTTIPDQYLFKDWGIGSPAGNVPVDNWSGRFVREINFPGGDYHFHCQHDDGCKIYIDGQEKLNAWWDSSFDGHDWTGPLTQGLHEVKVEFYDQGGGAHLEAWWQGPGFFPRFPTCDPFQWCGDYWGNTQLAGSPPMTRNEGGGFLMAGWAFNSPGYSLPADNFSARFVRDTPFSCGTYRFHIEADDGVRFYVDSVLKLDEWHNKTSDYYDVDVPLTDGNHVLKVNYFEAAGDTAMRMSWSQLSACPTPTPTNTPTPTQAPSTATFAPTDDTYAESATPNTALGSDPYLNIDASPQEVGYLKFNLGSLSGANVSSAKLRIYVANASTDTQQIRETSTSWSEGTLTWNNKPTLNGTVVGTISTGGTANVWKEVDITASVQAHVGGQYAIGIDTAGGDGLGFPSSENASNQVQLVVNYTAGPTPTATSTPTNTPIPTATPVTTSFSPSDDTYAESATPGTALGSDTYLNIDADPAEIAYLKFNLASLAGKTVTSAKLRFYVANASGNSQSIHETSTSWSEGTLTWNNKPALDSAVVGTISTGGTANVWYEVSITASVQAHVGGQYAIGIDTSGSDGLGFPSSENGSNPVVLVVSYN